MSDGYDYEYENLVTFVRREMFGWDERDLTADEWRAIHDEAGRRRGGSDEDKLCRNLINFEKEADSAFRVLVSALQRFNAVCAKWEGLFPAPRQEASPAEAATVGKVALDMAEAMNKLNGAAVTLGRIVGSP